MVSEEDASLDLCLTQSAEETSGELRSVLLSAAARIHALTAENEALRRERDEIAKLYERQTCWISEWRLARENERIGLERRAESSEALAAELREKLTEAEKYNGFHQQACLRIERLEKALLRLQNGVAVALDALPEDQQDGTVGNFLAAIHRECCTGLSAGKGADECEGSTP